jgi:hypothetical protein
VKEPKESVSSIVVNMLRDIRARDPEAFANLVTWRTNIDIEVGKHPTLQLSPVRGKSQLSIVGLLNSVLLAAGEPKVAAVVDNDTIVGFTILESTFSDLIRMPTPMQSESA